MDMGKSTWAIRLRGQLNNGNRSETGNSLDTVPYIKKNLQYSNCSRKASLHSLLDIEVSKSIHIKANFSVFTQRVLIYI